MNKLLKYNLKNNKNVIGKLVSLHLVFILLAALGHNFIINNASAKMILLLGLFIFLIFNIFYLIYSVKRDYYKNSVILTYSLPLSPVKILMAKLVELCLVYILNFLFFFIFFKIVNCRLNSSISYYFLLGLIWDLIFASIISLIIQVKRFDLEISFYFYIIGLFVLILLFGYIICKYLSFVIVNGSLQKASPIGYAFIYPFVKGKYDLYKNITPIIYYILALILVIFVNKLNLRDNIDL